MLALGDRLARRQGLSRRRFFPIATGMAAGFVAMNQTYWRLFDLTEAEATTPELADARADSLNGQFIRGMQTHFLRDDTRLDSFVKQREAVGKSGWNPELTDQPQTLDNLKLNNYFKETYLDSDLEIALISSAPSDIPQEWLLTNEMMSQARAIFSGNSRATIQFRAGATCRAGRRPFRGDEVRVSTRQPGARQPALRLRATRLIRYAELRRAGRRSPPAPGAARGSGASPRGRARARCAPESVRRRAADRSLPACRRHGTRW